MIEDDEMRLIFFDPDAFGEEITVVPVDGPPVTLSGIYDAHPSDHFMTLRHGAQASGSSPQFRCRASEAPKQWAGNATATIRGQSYSIFDVKQDGTGMAIVTVKRL